MNDIELVGLIAKGYSSKQIAAELHYSEVTIESYRFRLFRKYNCKNAPHLVAYFYEIGKLKPLNGNEKQGNETYQIGQVGQLWEHDICR